MALTSEQPEDMIMKRPVGLRQEGQRAWLTSGQADLTAE